MGDLDLDFAGTGFVEVSYEQSQNTWDIIGGFFEQEDSFTQLLNVRSGSGPGIVLANIDYTGSLTSDFGGDGLAYIKDAVLDDYQLWYSDSIRMTNGSYVARVHSLNSYSYRLVAILPDGRLDTSFGGHGNVPTTPGAKLYAHPAGGFLTSFSNSGSNDTHEIWKYLPDGTIDRNFGFEGQLVFPRMAARAPRFDAEGNMTIYGSRYDHATATDSFVQIRFLPNGARDSSFGTNGELITENFFSNSTIVFSELAGYTSRQIKETSASGTIVEMTSVTEEGALNENFGVNGRATIQIPGFQRSLGVFNYQSLSDGSLLLGFTERIDGSNSRIILAKVNAAGQLEPTFGVNGIMANLVADSLQTRQVFESKQGDLYVYGESFRKNDPFVMKVSQDGRVDRTFGDDGVLFRNHTPDSVGVEEMQINVLPSQDWLLSSGWVGNTPFVGETKQFTSDGVLRSSHAFGGMNTRLERIATASDGGWFAITPNLGQSGSDVISISKFNEDGELDDNFGSGGTTTIRTPELDAINVSQQRDGSIVVFGSAVRWASDDDIDQLGQTVAIRINNLGLDESFGVAGVTRLTQGSFLKGISLPDGGQFLMFAENTGAGDLLLLRLTSNGNLATGFGDNGRTHPPVRFQTLMASSVDELGRLLLVTKFQNKFKLVRLTPAGSLDLTFSNDGMFDLPFAGVPDQPIQILAGRGLILIAGNDLRERDSSVRMIALDYDGELRTQLNGSGTKDFDFSESLESITDLQFDTRGDVLLGITFSDTTDRLGRVYRIEGTRPSTEHNWYLPADVNNDLIVSPIDALLVINHLNGMEMEPPFLPDTSNDAYISPIDALIVINYINNQGGSGEGESSRGLLEPIADESLAMEVGNWDFTADFLFDLQNRRKDR